MKSKLLFFLLVSVPSVACALIGAQDTYAYIPLPTTDNISVISPDGSQNFSVDENLKDQSQRWYNRAFTAESGQCTENGSRSDLRLDFQQQFQSGGFRSVIQLHRNQSEWFASPETFMGNALGVLVLWNNNTDVPLKFFDWGVGSYLSIDNSSTDNLNWGFLTISNSGTYNFECGTHTSGNTDLFGNWSTMVNSSGIIYSGTHPDVGNLGYIYYSHQTINYPSDYDDGFPPTDPPVTSKNVKYWVNFTYTNTTDQLIANYIGKRTDPVSSLSDPKWIWWTLYKDAPNVTDGENVCDVTELASKPFNMNQECPDLVIDNEAQYFLRAGVNPINNPDIARDDVEITYLWAVFVIDFSELSQGTTEDCIAGATDPTNGVMCGAPKVIDFNACFTPTFPFVDPFTCADNFTLIFNLLTTGSITAIPKWNYTPGCTSLNTMDDWLNLPSGYTVCPQFPASVRNVITPFIAFMLGIVTIGFINRHNRDVSGRGM